MNQNSRVITTQTILNTTPNIGAGIKGLRSIAKDLIQFGVTIEREVVRVAAEGNMVAVHSRVSTGEVTWSNGYDHPS